MKGALLASQRYGPKKADQEFEEVAGRRLREQRRTRSRVLPHDISIQVRSRTSNFEQFTDELIDVHLEGSGLPT